MESGADDEVIACAGAAAECHVHAFAILRDCSDGVAGTQLGACLERCALENALQRHAGNVVKGRNIRA